MAAGDIKVHHGTVTLTGTSGTATLSPAVGALSKAFVMVCNVAYASMGDDVSGSQDDPRSFSVTADITATDTVTVTRANSTGTVVVQFMVWEYVGAGAGANEFKVHRPGSAVSTTFAYAYEYVTLDSSSNPWMQIPGCRSNATDPDGTSFLSLHAGGTEGGSLRQGAAAYIVRSSDNTDSTATVEGQVVEWKGSNWNLFQAEPGFTPGTAYLYDNTGTPSYASYGDIDWDSALIFSSKHVDRDYNATANDWYDDADDANDIGWTMRPTDEYGYDKVQFDVDNAVYYDNDHLGTATVIENTGSGFLTVSRIDSIDGGASNLSASTTNDYTVSSIDTSAGGALVTAWTDSTLGDMRPALYNWHLPSSTTLRLERDTSTGTGEFAAQLFQFEAAAVIDLPHLSTTTTHHGLSVQGPIVLPHHETSTTHHGLSLPSSIAHRDTRYYASGTIATDLGQYETNLTASGVGGYEASSARTNITGERNVYYRGDLSTADTNAVLVRHGDQTTVTTNTYGMAVSGTDEIQVLYGSTSLISIDAGLSGTDQDYSIGWSTRANPLTTGASDAQVSELWVYNHDTGDRYFEQATHAAPSGSDGYTFSVAGWWDGATMTGAPANAPSDVRVGTTFYTAVQYEEEFVGASPWASTHDTRQPKAPVWKASGAASEGEWLGWQTQYAAWAARNADRRLASPLVNAVYRDAEEFSLVSGLYEPQYRHIYAPGDQTTYQMPASYLWWCKVPMTVQRVRVRVCITSYPTSGADVPVGLTCYSMDRPPPWPCNWKRCKPVVGTYSHSSSADREWVDLGELEIVRLLEGGAAYNNTTHLALGYAIDPAGTANNDTDARIIVHGWQVVPVISNATNGPEMGLQPAPINPGGLAPFQLLSGG
jgi:hypothetical protein